MKRSEAIEIIKSLVYNSSKADLDMTNDEAEFVLNGLLALGFKPPRLPEDMVQAKMHVYYAGYTINEFEEDFYKDDKAVEALNKRLEAQERRIKRIQEKKNASST